MRLAPCFQTQCPFKTLTLNTRPDLDIYLPTHPRIYVSVPCTLYHAAMPKIITSRMMGGLGYIRVFFVFFLVRNGLLLW